MDLADAFSDFDLAFAGGFLRFDVDFDFADWDFFETLRDFDLEGAFLVVAIALLLNKTGIPAIIGHEYTHIMQFKRALPLRGKSIE